MHISMRVRKSEQVALSCTFDIVQAQRWYTNRPHSQDVGSSTLPQSSMEAHRGPYLEDSSLLRGPSPLPCYFGGVYSIFEALF